MGAFYICFIAYLKIGSKFHYLGQPIQVSPYYLLKTYIAQPRVSLPYNRYSVFALFILFNNSELSGSSGLTVT
jgi:hypothetical protein